MYTQKNVSTVLIQAIHFSISTQFKYEKVLFDPEIRPYQVLLFRTRVHMEIRMKGYSTFPEVPALVEPHHHIV